MMESILILPPRPLFSPFQCHVSLDRIDALLTCLRVVKMRLTAMISCSFQCIPCHWWNVTHGTQWYLTFHLLVYAEMAKLSLPLLERVTICLLQAKIVKIECRSMFFVLRASWMIYRPMHHHSDRFLQKNIFYGCHLYLGFPCHPQSCHRSGSIFWVDWIQNQYVWVPWLWHPESLNTTGSHCRR